MKKQYFRPELKLIQFNYEKVMASSCKQTGAVGDDEDATVCQWYIPEYVISRMARSSCFDSSSGHPYD